jgi:hypothetical protein
MKDTKFKVGEYELESDLLVEHIPDTCNFKIINVNNIDISQAVDILIMGEEPSGDELFLINREEMICQSYDGRINRKTKDIHAFIVFPSDFPSIKGTVRLEKYTLAFRIEDLVQNKIEVESALKAVSENIESHIKYFNELK